MLDEGDANRGPTGFPDLVGDYLDGTLWQGGRVSVRVSEQVWRYSSHSGTELLLLLAIADHANDAGFAYPSISTLAAKCRMTGRNVNLLMVALRASGELQVERNAGPKGVNVYRIVSAAPLKTVSPLKDVSPLKPSSFTPEASFSESLKRASHEPSENRHEPSSEREGRGEQSAEKPHPSRSRPSRIPEDWRPDDKLHAWAAAERPDLHLEAVIEQFRDHWLAKGEARASWDASFRLWVRRERKHAAAGGPTSLAQQRLSKRDGAARAIFDWT